MLGHASHSASLVLQNTLPRIGATQLTGALLRHRAVNQRQYSSSATSKQWAVTNNRKVVSPNLRQRRPIVNGESVPFHVSDLHRGATTTPHSVGTQASNTNRLSYNSNPVNKSKIRYDSDLIVILDMDECLIHSQFLSSQNARVYSHQLLNQKRSNQTSARQMVDSFRFTLPDGDLVHVNMRPGVRDFLQAVTAKYETHVFTAAVEVYAKPLMDHLDPHGAIAGHWYREHCVFDPSQQAYVKDLDRLPISQSLDRVVLVDNNPMSFLANPSNGILVSSFYNDPNDTSLQSVWQLLQELDSHSDVRPHLDERFGLKSALSVISSSSPPR